MAKIYWWHSPTASSLWTRTGRDDTQQYPCDNDRACGTRLTESLSCYDRQVSVLTVEHPPSDSGKGAPPDAEPNAVESVALSDTMAVAVYRNKTLALWSLEGHKLIAQR